MKSAPKPKNEKVRLESLKSLNILDSLPEADFDDIALVASQICDTPIAVISLIDDKRQWFKSKVGFTATETPREFAFCAHAILGEEVFVVNDASKDERFSDNPMVTGGLKVQFYAGAPLISPDGFPIGTLCVIDSKPRILSKEQLNSLKALSNQISRLLDLKVQLNKIKLSEEILQIKKISLDNISDGVILWNAEATLIDFNPAAMKILGLTHDEMFTRMGTGPTWEAFTEDGLALDAKDHPATLVLKTRRTHKLVVGIRKSETDVMWLLVSGTPLFLNESSKLSGVVVSFTDITSQTLLRQMHANNTKHLELILNGLPARVGHWSRDLLNLSANVSYASYFGKSLAEIRGRPMEEILGKELFESFLPEIKNVLNGNSQTFEREMSQSNGEVRVLLINYIPVVEESVVMSFLVITSDITDSKETELKRRHLEAQLGESSRLSTLGEMAGGIAHEINTPLAVIQGKAEILLEKIEDDSFDLTSGAKDLRTIKTTVARIAKIIIGLRTYSRDAKNDPFEITNFREVLENTITLCNERFKNKNVEIKLSCDASINIEARQAQLSQVVMNLLSNSSDAIENLLEKHIDIKVTVDGAKIKATFTDSGAGISEVTAKKLMQPFFTTKEVGKGTGLGLSISKNIVETHGGSLVYDRSYKNTTFVLLLPLKQTGKNGKTA